IAIATGDPAGIGPEISLKAALDRNVREACNPILVSDARVLERHAQACGIAVDLHAVERVADAHWSGGVGEVLGSMQADVGRLGFGAVDAAGGRTALAFAGLAIDAALANEVDAVVAAPQNETAIALAGIAFDGHPSFVARATGTDVDDVYLMLCFGDTR